MVAPGGLLCGGFVRAVPSPDEAYHPSDGQIAANSSLYETLFLNYSYENSLQSNVGIYGEHAHML